MYGKKWVFEAAGGVAKGFGGPSSHPNPPLHEALFGKNAVSTLFPLEQHTKWRFKL